MITVVAVPHVLRQVVGGDFVHALGGQEGPAWIPDEHLGAGARVRGWGVARLLQRHNKGSRQSGCAVTISP